MRRRKPGRTFLSDDALLAGMVAGDPQASVAFVRRFQHVVFGLATVMVSDVAAAEDVSQLAFERAWRHGEMYDPRRGSVQAWLLTITRNLAIDHLRRRRVRPEDGNEMAEISSGQPGPEERAVTDESCQRLRSAIRALPAAQSRALLLAAFRGWTAAEIAEAEGIPVGTAKTRIHAAMGKLRSELATAAEDAER